MKSNLFIFIPIIFCLGLLLNSCDKVDDPFADQDLSEVILDETVVYTTIEDDSNGRRALLMDFTGHNCVNCPAAALEAKRIHEDYPEDVVIMAVHPTIDQLTTPLNFHPENGFQTDWTTPVGEYLQALYIIPQSIPKGVISGKEIGGSFALNRGDWRGVVETTIDEAQPFTINVEKGYSESLRSFVVDAEVTSLTEVDGGLAIVVALLESGMEDWQLNGTPAFPSDPAYPGGEIENYIHNHVLRQHLNGFGGADLTTATVAADDNFNYRVAANISPDYIAENVEIVVYVYNKASLEIYHIVDFRLID